MDIMNILFHDDLGAIRNRFVDSIIEEGDGLLVLSLTEEESFFNYKSVVHIEFKDNVICSIKHTYSKKDFSNIEWLEFMRSLKTKLKFTDMELGYRIRVSYTKDHIDYVHYKKEW